MINILLSIFIIINIVLLGALFTSSLVIKNKLFSIVFAMNLVVSFVALNAIN